MKIRSVVAPTVISDESKKVIDEKVIDKKATDEKAIDKKATDEKAIDKKETDEKAIDVKEKKDLGDVVNINTYVNEIVTSIPNLITKHRQTKPNDPWVFIYKYQSYPQMNDM